jgi:hypothetical protein
MWASNYRVKKTIDNIEKRAAKINTKWLKNSQQYFERGN